MVPNWPVATQSQAHLADQEGIRLRGKSRANMGTSRGKSWGYQGDLGMQEINWDSNGLRNGGEVNQESKADLIHMMGGMTYMTDNMMGCNIVPCIF